MVPNSKNKIKNVYERYRYSHFNTGCPTDMVMPSDQILKIEKSHVSKSKPCFEILEKKALRWHFKTCKNQI